MRDAIKQLTSITLVRYGVAGACAAITHLLIFELLLRFTAVEILLASAIGFIFAIAVNYPLQYFWTFQSSSAHGQAFGRYLAVTMLMLAANIWLMYLLLPLLPIPPTLCQALVIVIVFIINFLFNRSFTFNVSKSE